MPPKVEEDTKNKKPAGNTKRQKIVKACKDCRRRKVKCDGATPCGTCRRSSIPCVFESTSPKRGTSKHYIESLEYRLSVMEKAVNSLSGPTADIVKEAVRREEEQQQQQLQQTSVTPELMIVNAEDRYTLNEFGSPSYMQEYYQSSSSSSSPKSIDSQHSSGRFNRQDEIEINNHLKFYLSQIQPYFPLFVPTYFNQQYAAQELPKILIYSMCALSCIYQQMEEHYSYYQRAMVMLDESIGRPSLSLVQTLLLLIKYKEYNNSSNFFETTKSLMARTIEVCNILSLEKITTPNDSAAETRKRTYCMVFTYNTLLCVEQGMINDLTLQKEHYPCTVSDESSIDCQSHIIKFAHTLQQIHKHVSRMNQRQDVQKSLRSQNQAVEEHIAIFQLQVKIESDLLNLPLNLTLYQQQQSYKNQPSFPAEDIVVTVSPMTRLLHMVYHLNVILLHYHYSRYPLPMTHSNDSITIYPHDQLASSSASVMIRLVEGLIADPLQSFRYSPRGLQFLVHCLSCAFTVLKYEITNPSNPKTYYEEYQRCAHLMQKVGSASPSNEMRNYARELDLAAINLDVSSLQVSSNTPSTSPVVETTKIRRNTISHRPSQQQQQQVVPPSLLQLSSTGVSQQFTLQHHPLHNIHASPLAVQQQQQQHMQSPQQQQQQHQHHQMLRGSTQSCNDLRSMNRLQSSLSPPPPPIQTQFTSNSFTQHRKPVGSVISSSTTGSSQGPYRGNNVRNVSPSLPYVKPFDNPPQMSQSSGFPRQPAAALSTAAGKMKRIKKSVSIQGISTYRQQQQQQQYQNQQMQHYQMYQQQQQMNFQQQLTSLLTEPNLVHRPYQPSFDDKYMEDDFSMNVDDLSFLSNYPVMDDQRSEGHQLL